MYTFFFFNCRRLFCFESTRAKFRSVCVKLLFGWSELMKFPNIGDFLCFNHVVVWLITNQCNLNSQMTNRIDVKIMSLITVDYFVLRVQGQSLDPYVWNYSLFASIVRPFSKFSPYIICAVNSKIGKLYSVFASYPNVYKILGFTSGYLFMADKRGCLKVGKQNL